MDEDELAGKLSQQLAAARQQKEIIKSYAEGRADTEPAVPSNPRDARNRRVEITLARTASPAESRTAP